MKGAPELVPVGVNVVGTGRVRGNAGGYGTYGLRRGVGQGRPAGDTVSGYGLE